MRLLCTVTGQYIEINDPGRVEYAILSHTWATDGSEQSYNEIREIQKACNLPLLFEQSVDHVPYYRQPTTATIWEDSKVSMKVWMACAVALEQGFRFIWIDSSCIDKTSSSELSEAINSMCAYRSASICIAYLADVSDDEDPRTPGSSFRRSRWFTRGWTLQELIAPKVVVFLSSDWEFLGTKSDFADVVREVTNIDLQVLTHEKQLNEVSVATRMSWSAGRMTTRAEDRAYSLLGIFDITMPTVYGEGSRAFLRLQEEILKRIPDQTIFSWGAHYRLPSSFSPSASPSVCPEQRPASPRLPFLAQSPDQFACPGSAIDVVPHRSFTNHIGMPNLGYTTFAFTSFGLRASFPVVPLVSTAIPRRFLRGTPDNAILVILPCRPHGLEEALMAVVCSITDVGEVMRVSFDVGEVPERNHWMLVLPPEQILVCRPHLDVKEIYAAVETREAPCSASPVHGAARAKWHWRKRSSLSAPHPSPLSSSTFSPYGLYQRRWANPLSPLPTMHGNTNKTYSFVSLPGNTVRKRPRRRYDEIEKLYHCSWPGCTKAYGTLNHLNAHITMQRHGPKRHPNEFKELRKQWRLEKKMAEEQERTHATQHVLLTDGAIAQTTSAGISTEPSLLYPLTLPTSLDTQYGPGPSRT